jgi:hypothetical protein
LFLGCDFKTASGKGMRHPAQLQLDEHTYLNLVDINVVGIAFFHVPRAPELATPGLVCPQSLSVEYTVKAKNRRRFFVTLFTKNEDKKNPAKAGFVSEILRLRETGITPCANHRSPRSLHPWCSRLLQTLATQ